MSKNNRVLSWLGCDKFHEGKKTGCGGEGVDGTRKGSGGIILNGVVRAASLRMFQ